MPEDKSSDSSVDVFVAWAKNRLDDVAVHAKILEKNLDKLHGDVRRQTEEAIASAKTLIGAGEEKLEEFREQGEVALTETHQWFVDCWEQFQKDALESERRARKGKE